MGFSYLNWWI